MKKPHPDSPPKYQQQIPKVGFGRSAFFAMCLLGVDHEIVGYGTYRGEQHAYVLTPAGAGGGRRRATR